MCELLSLLGSGDSFPFLTSPEFYRRMVLLFILNLVQGTAHNLSAFCFALLPCLLSYVPSIPSPYGFTRAGEGSFWLA